MDAGLLDRRLDFEAPRQIEDGAGNYVDGFVLQFSQAASVKYLRGGESVLASRLNATQPVIVTVRRSVQSAAIAPDWRIVDKRGGVDEHGLPRVVYFIKEWPRESDDRGFLEMLAVRGTSA